MIKDPLSKFDGFQSLSMGVDSGRSPAVLDRTQLSWLVNGTTREGFVTCRPGLKKRTLKFLDADGNNDATLEAAFKTGGRFQFGHQYIADNGNDYIVVSIGGNLYRIHTGTYEVQDLTAQLWIDEPTRVHSDVSDFSWFLQAENFLIKQNGEDDPIIFDGAGVRLSNHKGKGGKEVPIGKSMEYNNGRVWVSSVDGYSFIGGNLVWGEGARADLLNFDENDFLNGGGSFTVGVQAGRISAMRSVALQDTTTGQGPLQVFTNKGVFSVNAPFDRETWSTTTNPIQTISMLSSGASGAYSTINVNGDLWYRSQDGIRSFVIGRRDHGTWVNTPLSREVRRALDYDAEILLKYGSAVLFDNRLLVTTQPSLKITSDGDIRGAIHKGLVVLDFAPVSQMFHRGNPLWDGVWTGLDILQVLTVEGAVTRCFAFALNSSNEIELWELTKTDRFDSDDNRIQWFLETPSYGFEDGGWNLKSLEYADVWSDRIAGEVDFTAKYREDSYPFWRSWHSWEVCAQYQNCEIACTPPEPKQEQYRPRQRLPQPSEDCDTVSEKPGRYGYRFAMRLEVTGHARIRNLRLIAHTQPEEAVGGCP